MLVVAAAISGCAVTAPGEIDAAQAPLPPYGLVSPGQAARVIAELEGTDGFVLLDIRTEAEVAASHLSGAETLDFYDPSFGDEIASMDRETTFLLYCRTGNRTGQASDILRDLGFARVYDLKGGLSAWTAGGFPVCSGGLTPEHVCVRFSADPGT